MGLRGDLKVKVKCIVPVIGVQVSGGRHVIIHLIFSVVVWVSVTTIFYRFLFSGLRLHNTPFQSKRKTDIFYWTTSPVSVMVTTSFWFSFRLLLVNIFGCCSGQWFLGVRIPIRMRLLRSSMSLILAVKRGFLTIPREEGFMASPKRLAHWQVTENGQDDDFQCFHFFPLFLNLDLLEGNQNLQCVAFIFAP